MTARAGLDVLGLLTLLLGGCGSPQPPELPNPPPESILDGTHQAVSKLEVDKAIDVALALRGAPMDHESILMDAGLTPESWEAMVVDIAADPKASSRYTEALAATSAPTVSPPSSD